MCGRRTPLLNLTVLGIFTDEYEFAVFAAVGQRVMRAWGVLSKHEEALSLGCVHDLPSRFPISFRCHPSVAQQYSTMKMT
ncbi:unnamed protein product [Macrosiphum euphorbiae]|uniref:Secreted protein n=1 Tax=Macrosiphum euphorbiae TaxID=13131 RepID=A0AAV0W241_9HEMI|nr:unnamed protein product [Macrosiphum euphorbiae]